jgi:uncharacterized phiE125 gp8 family phage protein
MHRPVLVTPPAVLPVFLVEAKAHLRVEHGDDDDLIEAFIRAATDHLDGWTGILGRCLVDQEWRQDFDAFGRTLPLPLGPVIAVSSVTWRNEAGQISTVPGTSYDLRTDAGGRACVRFDAGYSFPSGLHESRGVSVAFRAGYVTTPAVEPGEGDPPDPPGSPAVSTVPAALKTAILLMVAHWYQNREAVNVGNIVSQLPLGVEALIAPYRAVRI